jgi:4-hydroxybenzoyl-CoA thioesterase/acyl-CoA thioester hydrolase
MGKPFRTSRRIEFADTDAAGIAHFSAYFRLMEEAEHELLRSVGLSVLCRDDEGPISFPRVRAACDFSAALRFEDVADIDVALARLGRASIHYRFAFSRADEPIAAGEIVAVCCRVSPDAPPASIEIPAWIADKLRPFLRPEA